jgi:hypothetical protein
MRSNHPATALRGQATRLADFQRLKNNGALTERYAKDTVLIACACVGCGMTWLRDRSNNRAETVRDRLHARNHVETLHVEFYSAAGDVI